MNKFTQWQGKGFITNKTVHVTEDFETGNIIKVTYDDGTELTKDQIEEELF